MEEDLKHALIHCLRAQSFWEDAWTWLCLLHPPLHSVTWARDITCDPQFTSDDRAKITTIMWAIWHSRNRIKHGDEGRDPIATIGNIKDSISLLQLPRKETLVLPGYGWRPPEEGSVKINTDGALQIDEGRAVLEEWPDLPQHSWVHGANHTRESWIPR